MGLAVSCGMIYGQITFGVRPSPRAYSFCKQQYVTLQTAASRPLFQSLFHLPLSTEAYDQFLDFSSLIQGLQLHINSDIWTYIWGSAVFSASNLAYEQLIVHRDIHKFYNWLWKSAC